MRLDDLAAKNIGIWGFGVEGQSVAQRILTIDPSTTFTIIDDKRSIAAQAIERLGITGTLISSAEIVGAELDVVIKSPGISLYREEMVALKQHNISVTSVSSLWFAEPRTGKVIAVCGTKGKSTTASLITHLLREQNLRVQLAGNIGTPLSECWPDSTAADYWVIELSSYQLADLNAEFDALVLTNIYQDHIHWHGNVERYKADKLRALAMVKPSGIAVIPENLTDPAARYQSIQVKSDRVGEYQFDTRGITANAKTFYEITPSSHLQGVHNLCNACCALALIDALGHPVTTLDAPFETFNPLPHRLEVIGEHDDVRFINDSISTTPQSTIAALQAFESAEHIALIVGGQDRNVDLIPLIEHLNHHPRINVYAIPDTGHQIAKSIENVRVFDSLASATHAAYAASARPGLVLLSPGAASFNQFDNYQHRGESFSALFREIANG